MIRRPLLAIAVIIALSAAAASTQALTDADSAPSAFGLLTWQTAVESGATALPVPQGVR